MDVFVAVRVCEGVAVAVGAGVDVMVRVGGTDGEDVKVGIFVLACPEG
jgi:hypothetical protein